MFIILHTCFINIYLVICEVNSFVMLFRKYSIQNSYNFLEFNIKNILRIEINSFPMIIQTCSLIIFIAQIKFNSFISEILTFIGPLTFDVYLIHDNPFIRRNFIKTSFDQYSIDLTFLAIIIIIFKKAILII